MRIISYLSIRQNALLEKLGINIDDKEYSIEELEKIEDTVVKYIREKCMKNDEITEEGTEYEDIVDIITDFEYEVDPQKITLGDEIEEDSYVELKDGKMGTVIDITNEMYTVELDDNYKTGNIMHDIQIVTLFEIKKIISEKEKL